MTLMTRFTRASDRTCKLLLLSFWPVDSLPVDFGFLFFVNCKQFRVGEWDFPLGRTGGTSTFGRSSCDTKVVTQTDLQAPLSLSLVLLCDYYDFSLSVMWSISHIDFHQWLASVCLAGFLRPTRMSVSQWVKDIVLVVSCILGFANLQSFRLRGFDKMMINITQNGAQFSQR